MVTFKPEVRKHHKKKDGTFNVKIRVTFKRKIAYISTPFFVTSDQITKNFSKIKDQYVLDKLQQIVSRYRREVLRLESELHSFNIKSLVNHFKELENESPDYINFIEFGKKTVIQYKE